MKQTQSRRARVDAKAGFSLQYQQLEARHPLAVLQVIAGGETNQENLVLQIDNQTVQTWNNLGGNPDAGQFVTLTHTTADPLNPSQVRLMFTNDVYDPANNIDRNVRVDAIVIDGVRYETESALVYSTGTWLPADGIVPGFRQSEWLHADGYFQYANNPTGTAVQLRAKGDEGTERMELRIGGATVAAFNVSTNWANYEYVSSTSVDISQVRVYFTNDQWDPANNIDANLSVEHVRIGNTTYPTGAANVFSTGTWTENGLLPGYWQSQDLHTNGYFQYAAPANLGSLTLEQSVYRVAENIGSIGIKVNRVDGFDGSQTVDYRTVASSATAGSDFTNVSGRLTFLPGETSKTVFVTINNDTLVEGDELFSFTLDNVIGGAALRAPRTATITIEDNDAIRAQGTGLLGEYFDNLNFTSRFINRIDSTVDFNWALGAPAGGMGVDTFSVRWSGRLEPRFTETYTLSVTSDDGVRLWINNQLIIDRWIDQASTTHSATIALQAGVLADVRMEYYDNLQSADVQLRWQSARQTSQIIPASQLYPAPIPNPIPGNSLVSQNLFNGLMQPTAIDFSPNGANMYVALQSGIVRVARNGILNTTPFLDFRDRVNGVRDRGLIGMAVHPNFPATPYVYLAYTYDPPEVNAQAVGTLQGPDGRGNRAARVTRVTADAATNYTTAVANSEFVIVGKNSTWSNFNAFVNSTVNFTEPPGGRVSGQWVQDFIATDSESHTIGGLAFGTDGFLYVTTGDGASYNQVDPRADRVQDVNNLSGKVLRVDPITGNGLPGNPFFDNNVNSNRSKVWQSGLRNPFRLAIHPTSNRLIAGDVGWTQWEELNSAGAGANFGWPWYEGGNGTNVRTPGYRDLAAAQTFYANNNAVPAFYALNHAASGINAIVAGDFYTGSNFPGQYANNFFFNDLGQGIVRNISFNANGSVNQVQTFATGHGYVVAMKQGPDGNLYFADLDGQVGRWTFVESGTAQAAGSESVGAPPAILDDLSSLQSTGSNVIIASIDSGIATNHPQLAGKLWTNPYESIDGIDNDRNRIIDDVHGYDFVLGQGGLTDPTGHGTFLAGLMVGSGTGGSRGIAPGAKLMSLRVLDNTNVGQNDRIAAAIRYAVDQGAGIISMPMSTNNESQSIEDAIRWAAEKNVLVVVAAGNESAGQPGWLGRLSARFRNVLTVGALDATGALLSDSNRRGNSGAVQIDASGVLFGSDRENSATTYRGSSVSTAVVSAAAALIRSTDSRLTAEQVRQILVISGNMTGSGSDSLATLNIPEALSLALRTSQVAINRNGTQLTVSTSPWDDQLKFSLQSGELSVNGVRYEFTGWNAITEVKLTARGPGQQIQLTGSTSQNDIGQLNPNLAKLQSGAKTMTATGFAISELLGGDGTSTVEAIGTDGTDILTVAGNKFDLKVGSKSLRGLNFKSSSIFGGKGTDQLNLWGTAANETLRLSPSSVKMILDTRFVEAFSFEGQNIDLRSGHDEATLIGSTKSETVNLRPLGATWITSTINANLYNVERTIFHGGGGTDFLRFDDSLNREVVESLSLFTTIDGGSYYHQAHGFKNTSIHLSGGDDLVKLFGTKQAETVTAGTRQLRFSGSKFDTQIFGGSDIHLISGEGNDVANLVGSELEEIFWASPVFAQLDFGSRRLKFSQFKTVNFDGVSGNDLVTIVDGAGSDTLSLWRNEATLVGSNYSIRARNMKRLIGRSAIDAGTDRIVRRDPSLDYVFESFGDWVGS